MHDELLRSHPDISKRRHGGTRVPDRRLDLPLIPLRRQPRGRAIFARWQREERDDGNRDARNSVYLRSWRRDLQSAARPRRNVYIGESMWRMIRCRLCDSEVVHKAEPTFFRGSIKILLEFYMK